MYMLLLKMFVPKVLVPNCRNLELVPNMPKLLQMWMHWECLYKETPWIVQVNLNHNYIYSYRKTKDFCTYKGFQDMENKY